MFSYLIMVQNESVIIILLYTRLMLMGQAGVIIQVR